MFTNPGARIQLNLNAAPTIGQTFTLATAASGLDGPNSWNLSPAAASFGGVGYIFSLTKTATSTVAKVIGTAPSGAFYTGDQGSTLNATTGANTNWATDSSGFTDLAQQPSIPTAVTFSATGASNLNITELGQNYSWASLTMESDTVTINDTAANGANALTVSSAINVSSPGDTTLNVPLGGSATLTKSGTGNLNLGASNTFQGAVLLNQGITTLNGNNSGAVGNTTLGSGATLIVNAANNFTAGTFTMSGTNTVAPVLQLKADGATNFGKDIVLATASGGGNVLYTIEVGNNGSGSGLTHSIGKVSNATVNSRILTVNSPNGYGLVISEFAMNGGGGQANNITANTPVTVNEVTNPMSGYNTTNFNTLYLNGTAQGSSINGVIEDAVGGAFVPVNKGGYSRVIKQNTGTWTLSAANIYTGITQIDAGTLSVTGSTSALSAVTVNGAGTLAGTGTVAGSAGGAGTIAPGVNGVGILNTGPLNLSNAASTLAIDVNGATADKVVSSGAVTLGGKLTINLLGGFTQPSYVIAQGSSLTGTFASVPAGYTVTYTATQAILSQAGGAFATWIAGFTFAPGTNVTPAGDPDNDGASNILEFALNGIPNNGSNNGLKASVLQDVQAPAGKELTLVCAVRDGATFSTAGTTQVATIDGVTYTIEGSLNLVFPTSAVGAPGAASDTAPAGSGLPSLAGTNWEYRTFSLTASEGLSGKGFLRVRVTQP